MKRTKRVISLILVVTMLCSFLFVGASANSGILKLGDVNGDGKIAASDARLVLRCSAKIEVLTDEQNKVADINDDGVITAADARYILRYSAQLIDEIWEIRLPNEDNTYTVTFDFNYEGAPKTTQNVKIGECIDVSVIPEVPEREGYTFAGWYLKEDESDLSKQYDFSKKVTSDLTLYAIWIDIDKDTDGDDIPNDLEAYFNSDPYSSDTDEDGLNDYQEIVILGTNPEKKDSDDDSVFDSDEDADNDGLSNIFEFAYGTNPIAMDSDFDNIIDFEELNSIKYKTNPLEADSDNDGADDAWEIENGFDPTKYNDNFEIQEVSTTDDIVASVDVGLSGEKATTLSVEPILEHPFLTGNIPGYIGTPFDFNVEGNLEGASATISFTFDEKLLESDDFLPTIYYFNEKTQELEELLTTVVGNVASTTVDHFSSYILLNKVEFDKVWETEIKPPLSSGDPEEEATLDIVFVIDYSLSMEENDPYQLFKVLSEEFVNKLRDGKDKAGAVKFIRRATLVSTLTTDKESVITAINGISYDNGYGTYSGTDGSAGIKMALDQMATSDSEYQYIVFITDGEDNGYSYSYDSLIATANESNVTIYAVGMGSASESVLRKVSSETGGKYYHATTGVSVDDLINLDDVFEDIESETIDLTTDTDNDKIPDYYESRLSAGNGVRFCLDINNPDCDGDSLLDGEEIVITTSVDGKVYGKLISDPWSVNSDLDIYNDYDEVKKYGSDPLIKNVAYSEDDTSFLIEDENFVSDKYMDFYENDWYGWLERASVWLGNNIFGSNYDTTYLYKTILMDYLEQMVEESTATNEIRELVGFTHKILSQMNTNVGEVLKVADKSNAELLKNLQQQLNTYAKNLDDIANADLINAGFTKAEIYKLWDDTFAEYRKVSDEIPQLNKKIEFNTKLGKASEVAGVVLDIADVIISGYDFYKEYNTFASAISGMDTCLDTLKTIQNSSEAPSELKTAAKELHKVIEEQKINNLDTFFDGLKKVGGKVVNVSVVFIPVVGKYIAAAKLVLGIGDFILNVSDVAEQCACLYAISKSSSILAKDFSKSVASGNHNGKWLNVYNNYVVSTEKYFDLAIMRKTSENQMKKADEANSFLIEWLFTDIMYKLEDIESNITKIDSIKYKYVAAGV